MKDIDNNLNIFSNINQYNNNNNNINQIIKNKYLELILNYNIEKMFSELNVDNEFLYWYNYKNNYYFR